MDYVDAVLFLPRAILDACTTLSIIYIPYTHPLPRFPSIVPRTLSRINYSTAASLIKGNIYTAFGIYMFTHGFQVFFTIVELFPKIFMCGLDTSAVSSESIIFKISLLLKIAFILFTLFIYLFIYS